MSLGDKTYDDLAKDLFKHQRESLLPTAKDMQVEHKYMLAMCEDEGHHRTGQWQSPGVDTCYCGHNMVLFVKT